MTEPSGEFPPGATTLHLLPVEAWSTAQDLPTYVPAAYATDGFVHCTNGDEELVAVGNRYYRNDPRPYLALTIAIDKERLPEFKEKLKAIRYELADFFQPEGNSNLNEVYQLTMALFPLTDGVDG